MTHQRKNIVEPYQSLTPRSAKDHINSMKQHVKVWDQML